MENFTSGTCGTDPCSTDTCGAGSLSSPLCHPDLALLPQVPEMRLIGVLGSCMVTMSCAAEGFVISTGSGITVSKSPCFPIAWERELLLDGENVVLGDDNLPIEDQPPSVESVIVTNDDGCMRRYRGASNKRQKLISNNGEVSWVDDPIPLEEEEEQSFCTTTTCELYVVPGGGPYTLTVAESGFFVVGEGVAVGETLFKINSKPAAGVLVVEPVSTIAAGKSIPAGSLACYSVVSYRCDNTPTYDPDVDGGITHVKVCTEDGGDRILSPEPDKILVGVLQEDETTVLWELQAKASAVTGLSFFPVTKQTKLVSDVRIRDTMHETQITFDAPPAAQIPPTDPGRDIYMVVNIYHEMSMSTLRNWWCYVYDKAGGNANDLVMLHRQTNTSNHVMGSAESTQAIIKCVDQNNPRVLKLWHYLTGAYQDNPLSSVLRAQLVGYIA